MPVNLGTGLPRALANSERGRLLFNIDELSCSDEVESDAQVSTADGVDL
jgi:hypothetical protein